MYESGKGIEKDLQKAKELYKKASEKGNIHATYNLARLTETADKEHKVISLYEMSAKKNHKESLKRLGNIYGDGTGIPQRDIKKAIEYYEKAIKLGCDDSLYFLAEIYELGTDVPQDIPKAIFYYQKGVEKGDLSSMNYYGKILIDGRGGTEKNIQK